MIEFSPGALEWIGAGTVVTLLGWLIKFQGWTFLVAGYDSSTEIPEDVVRDISGSTILRVGIATAAIGLIRLVTDVPVGLRLLFGALVVVAVLRMIYRVRSYESADTA
ncbi:DUF3784 domain-containing protein [Halorarius halobius]|uniref:DUF3784 domain-containing protein n=1 Tax=Halorarius halobius TaxID=2962671 RepID=UPI0020CBF620|nr:DUF3784 domain-containing protein [Halorarius halobius]